MLITTRDKHYYDEDNIEVGKAINCKVAVNHVVELTEEEKAQAKQDAIKQYQRQEFEKIQNRYSKKKKTEDTTNTMQQLLFDF